MARWRKALRGILASALFVGGLSWVVPSAQALTGGRVHFQNAVRLIDTRAFNPAANPVTGIEANTPYLLPGSGILNVTIIRTVFDPRSPAPDMSATVYPCSGSPSNTPTFLLRERELFDTSRILATSPGGDCVIASAHFDIIVDRVGSIDATPTGSGNQYVPLTPTVIDDNDHDETGDGPATVVTIADHLPAGATGAAVLIAANALTNAQGYLQAYGCAHSVPQAHDMLTGMSRTDGVVYVPLAAGEQLCLFSARDIHTRVTLLGYFTNDGPDPTRLPPTISYSGGDLSAPGLRTITPVRVLDTRNAIGRPGTSKVAANGTVVVSFGDQVGPSTTAVVLNVTVTQPDGAGFITAWPCSDVRPTASSLNYVKGETVPNLVNVKLGLDRTVCLFTQSATHLIVDLSATFELEGGEPGTAITPERILDTRDGTGAAERPMNAGETLHLTLAGRAGLPLTGVGAATMNVTSTQSVGSGFLTVWPCDQPQPTASNVNFVPGDTVPNLVTTGVAADGTVCIFASAATEVIADLGMWFATTETTGFVELTPDRLLDTRIPVGVPAKGKVNANSVTTLQVAGRGGVPATGADAVALNVTVDSPEGAGFITVWPCHKSLPVVSNLNFVAGTTVPNAVTVKLSVAGTVCLYSTSRAHLIADVAGYYTAATQPALVATPS